MNIIIKQKMFFILYKKKKILTPLRIASAPLLSALYLHHTPEGLQSALLVITVSVTGYYSQYNWLLPSMLLVITISITGYYHQCYWLLQSVLLVITVSITGYYNQYYWLVLQCSVQNGVGPIN